MAKSSRKYHLEIQQHRKNPIGIFRSTYWEDGKIRHDTLCRLNGMSLTQLRAIQAAVQGRVILKEDFEITANREYGASYAIISLIKQLKLHEVIFSRPSEDFVKATLAMIAGRILYAGSKLALSHCGSHSALWDICGIQDVDVNECCYKPMDRLLERQDAIQKKLAAKHLSDGILVLYDITSCYMEGEYTDSDLVAFGYNRDRKRGHEQIVISLLCTKDGCPIAVEVLRGNTKDETTVMSKIEEIRTKYGLEQVIFVGDRGMITKTNYEKINHDHVKVISAINHNSIRSLCQQEVIQLSLFDENNVVEVISEGIRYCLCKNPLMASKEGATRLSLLQKTTELLDKIISSTRKTKYSKAVRAGKVVAKYKMGKFIIFEGSDDNLSYRLDNEKIAQEASLDGCYVIFTDVSPEDMTAVEAVESYKSLALVEQAFRSLKMVQLEIRPIYHKTDDRIKCHVFICMLAYYVMWHMKQKLMPLFNSNGVGRERKYTFTYVLDSLKSLSIQDVIVCGVTSTVISKPTPEQSKIFSFLGVKPPSAV